MACRVREAVDTNVLLRLILRDVPEQCLKVQDLLLRQKACYDVADLAVEEVVYVLQKGFGWTRAGIVEALRSVLDLSWFDYNRALFTRVFPLYLEHPGLSFNDCCLAVYAELNQTEPLWTLDQDLAKQVPAAKLLV